MIRHLCCPGFSGISFRIASEIRSLEALAALLDALGSAERPTLVLLDDCQWADEMTLKLLNHWQGRPEREGSEGSGLGSGGWLLVVAAFRSEEAPARSLLRTLQPLAHVILAPFRDEEVRQLVLKQA